MLSKIRRLLVWFLEPKKWKYRVFFALALVEAFAAIVHAWNGSDNVRVFIEFLLSSFYIYLAYAWRERYRAKIEREIWDRKYGHLFQPRNEDTQ